MRSEDRQRPLSGSQSCCWSNPALLGLFHVVVLLRVRKGLLAPKDRKQVPWIDPEFLIQEVWAGAQEIVFLRSFQVIPMLIQGPHFKDHRSPGIVHIYLPFWTFPPSWFGTSSCIPFPSKKKTKLPRLHLGSSEGKSYNPLFQNQGPWICSWTSMNRLHFSLCLLVCKMVDCVILKGKF
jgi:hypothetical protein